jgi:hypothetical protein
MDETVRKPRKRGKGHSARKSFTAGIREKLHNNTKSVTGTIEDASVYFHGANVEETVETHVVPRKSLTVKQLLGVLPQDIEVETRELRRTQLDKRTGRMVETTDQVSNVVWRSDKTLLRKGNPFADNKPLFRQGAVREGQNTRKFVVTEHPTARQMPKEFQEPDPNTPATRVDIDIEL